MLSLIPSTYPDMISNRLSAQALSKGFIQRMETSKRTRPKKHISSRSVLLLAHIAVAMAEGRPLSSGAVGNGGARTDRHYLFCEGGICHSGPIPV